MHKNEWKRIIICNICPGGMSDFVDNGFEHLLCHLCIVAETNKES